MMNRSRRFAESERGSALVLVILLSLILSATAIVALRDIARTTRGSAVFRTKAQAQTVSDSADRLFLEYAGNRAGVVVHALQETSYGGQDYGQTNADGDAVGTSVYGAAAGFADIDGDDSTSLEERRRALAVRGTDLEFTPGDLAADCGANCDPMLEAHNDGVETGLLTWGEDSANLERSFERRRPTQWRVRIRDLAEGFPAVGYSESYCFKTALLAAEATVGSPDPDWTRANNVSSARHGIGAALGPVECGYN